MRYFSGSHAALRMAESTLLHELISHSAHRSAERQRIDVWRLDVELRSACMPICAALPAGSRRLASSAASGSAIYLEKRFEAVVASFGAAAAGGVFVPLNPLLKPEQVELHPARLQCTRAGRIARDGWRCWPRRLASAPTCATSW